MTAVERAERKVSLLRDAEILVARLRINAAEHNHLLAERAAACKALRDAGASIEEIQDVLAVSRSRVQQILRGSRM